MASGKSPYLEDTPGKGESAHDYLRGSTLAKTSSEKVIQGAQSHRQPESPRTLLARELNENHDEDEEEQAQSARPPVLQLNRNLSKNTMSSAIVSY